MDDHQKRLLNSLAFIFISVRITCVIVVEHLNEVFARRDGFRSRRVFSLALNVVLNILVRNGSALRKPIRAKQLALLTSSTRVSSNCFLVRLVYAIFKTRK